MTMQCKRISSADFTTWGQFNERAHSPKVIEDMTKFGSFTVEHKTFLIKYSKSSENVGAIKKSANIGTIQKIAWEPTSFFNRKNPKDFWIAKCHVKALNIANNIKGKLNDIKEDHKLFMKNIACPLFYPKQAIITDSKSISEDAEIMDNNHYSSLHLTKISRESGIISADFNGIVLKIRDDGSYLPYGRIMAYLLEAPNFDNLRNLFEALKVQPAGNMMLWQPYLKKYQEIFQAIEIAFNKIEQDKERAEVKKALNEQLNTLGIENWCRRAGDPEFDWVREYNDPKKIVQNCLKIAKNSGMNSQVERLNALYGKSQCIGLTSTQEKEFDEYILQQEKSERPAYFSKKRINKNLNCQAKDSLYPKQIFTCRHIAAYWILKRQQDKIDGKFDYNLIINKKSISKNMSIRALDDIINALFTQAYHYLVEHPDLGKFVDQQFVKMQDQNIFIKHFFVIGLTHATAIQLKISKNQHSIIFYDPNYTTTHQRMVRGENEHFYRLNMQDFLKKTDNNLYYGDHKISLICEIATQLEKHALQPAVNPHPALNDPPRFLISADISNVTPVVLWYMMGWNYSGNIAELRQKIAQLPHDKKIQCLAAKSTVGAPGIFSAMQYNHPQVIQQFGHLLSDSVFNAGELMQLISGIHEGEGYSALEIAIQSQSIDAIKVYGDIINTLPLSNSELWQIFQINKKSLLKNKNAANQAYFEIVEKSLLSKAQKEDLIYYYVPRNQTLIHHIDLKN